jgi:4-hydroxybenzoate polyprenyltransferase
MKCKSILNYAGQVRIYSFLDLIVLATALSRNVNVIIGIGLLWLSFLLYLEGVHKDELRLRIGEYFWAIPFFLSLFLLHFWVCLGFAVFSYLYTNKKKNKFFGISAPLWRGLQDGIIAFGFNPQIAILVFGLIFLRNLVADFRDAFDDKQRKINTIPVLLGVSKNQIWAFYAHIFLVITTTIIWFQYSFLDTRLILPIVILQLITYPLTPRLSNPKYLNLYNYAEQSHNR